MNTVKRSLAVIAATCLFFTGTSMAFAGDKDRDRDRDKDQDGSCQQYTGSSQFDQLLVQYGNGKGNSDADHDRAQDGSCQDA